MGASAARRKAARAVREFEAAAREALRCKDEPRRVGPLAESATRSAEQARARLSELARECASLPAEEQQRVEPMNQRLVSAFEAQCKALDSGLRGAMAAQQEATGAATAGRRGDNPFGDGSFAPGQQQQQQMLQRQQQDEEQRAALEQRLLHEQAVFNQEDLSQRESEFTRLRQNVNQLNEISREVATLVHEQGEDIEAIGANVDTAHENTRGGLEELRKTAMYRRKVNPFTCGFAALLALFVIVLVVLLAKHKI
ncbi:Syntaxin, putative [Hondaea fermentalgiana]|uniref:Syntaxin, putative n=1 Tax=Hondaea fermentalgiana TaxID=2315210 RepID=A0A2R5GP49_9STRA|nr:Syntaxin, putative [Hondaea fermentalgiana]|eukprot:GBG30091.1 Syntaxin, putative [Hondaea fermentalgiana]